MSHDQNFKNLILDYPRPALEFFAGSEAADLAEARIIPIRQEQLKERLGDRFRELDTPLLVEWPDGRRAAIVFVIEEHTDPRRFSIHRIAHYCLDLAELLDTDRVVPVVIFVHAGAYRTHLQLGGDRDTFLSFHFLACDLPHLPAAAYQDSPNIVARLTLPAMAYPADQRVAVYAAAQDGLAGLEADPEKRLKYLDFIDYYAQLGADDWQRYCREYVTQSQDRENAMRMRQYLEEEAMRAVRERVLREGRQEGLVSERQLLLRMTRRRFGEPTAEASAPLLAAIDDTARLEALGETLLDCADGAAWLAELRKIPS